MTTKQIVTDYITKFCYREGLTLSELLRDRPHVNRQDADIILSDMAAAGKIRIIAGKIYKA